MRVQDLKSAAYFFNLRRPGKKSVPLWYLTVYSSCVEIWKRGLELELRRDDPLQNSIRAASGREGKAVSAFRQQGDG